MYYSQLDTEEKLKVETDKIKDSVKAELKNLTDGIKNELTQLEEKVARLRTLAGLE